MVELARMTQINYKTLNNFANGNAGLGEDKLKTLAKTLGVSEQDILKEVRRPAGKYSPESGSLPLTLSEAAETTLDHVLLDFAKKLPGKTGHERARILDAIHSISLELQRRMEEDEDANPGEALADEVADRDLKDIEQSAQPGPGASGGAGAARKHGADRETKH